MYFSEEDFQLSEGGEDSEINAGTESSGGSGIFFNRDVTNSSHWSVPWSDLMMTMFVLFAVLYAYHASDKKVQAYSKRSEINFHEETKPAPTGDLSQFYEMSRETLRAENLQDIASVELIKKKAVKIILPGDILFDTGKAELKPGAIRSLKAVGKLIKKTNYAVTVAGYTDEVPIHTDKFPSNWELSTTRACAAARFLIDQTNIPPEQIRVIGYAANRPVESNDTPAGRAANRRVEIIVSKGNVSDTPAPS